MDSMEATSASTPNEPWSLLEKPTADWLNDMSCLMVVYVEPMLCSVGFLLNCACVAIFMNVSSQDYYRKTSLLLYLAALAVCNALQLLLSVFVIVLPAIEQFIFIEHPAQAQFLQRLNTRTVRIGYPLMLAASYASIWLLTLICAQRYQAICHPANPWKKRLAFVRNSKWAVVVVCAAALLLNVIRFWEMEWHGDSIVNTKLRESILYKIVQEGIVYGCIVYALPMMWLLWFNMNTARLVRSRELHVQISRRAAEYRTALMTVCVFVVFFLCTTLSISMRLLMIVADSIVLMSDLMWLMDVSNMMMNISALVTPIICFVFTRGFKDLFFAIRFAPTLKSPSFEQLAAKEAMCSKKLLA